MTAPYSRAFVDSIREMQERSLGQELALVCISASLPSIYVSQVLGVSRMTLHTWFRGGGIKEKKREKIEKFISLVKEDMSDGTLPAKSVRDARSYLQALCTVPLKTTTQQKKG